AGSDGVSVLAPFFGSQLRGGSRALRASLARRLRLCGRSAVPSVPFARRSRGAGGVGAYLRQPAASGGRDGQVGGGLRDRARLDWPEAGPGDRTDFTLPGPTPAIERPARTKVNHGSNG